MREPKTVTVHFTGPQRHFYDGLIQFRRNVLALRYSNVVIRLIIDTLERQASSCLPALIPMLDTFLRTGRFSGTNITDIEEDEEDQAFPPEMVDQAQRLRDMAVSLPLEDPKWDALLEIAQSTLDIQGPGKLLVFSFFLHTLNYLALRLTDKGFRVGLVTGLIADEEREDLRARFRKPKADSNAIDILLSSEVGCEGLDYEFCDRIVNYDIPWNPMRLEQRIGRIDRFGQTAEIVLIFNFITPETVEERIFFRCFERLGIFRETIGDCEEVLGELAITEQLLALARNPDLTPEQGEEKARQISDNAIRLLEEQRRLEKESGNLLGLDQSLIDEVDAAKTEGRFVSGGELRAMVNWFIAQPDLGGNIETHKGGPGLCRLRLKRSGRATLGDLLSSIGPSDRLKQTFKQWVEGSDPYLTITFEQQTAVARRDIPFITPTHPLARLAIQALSTQPEPLAAYVQCKETHLTSGHYVFCCELWESIAVRAEIRLISVAWHAGEQRATPELAERLLKLLCDSESREGLQPDNAILQSSLPQIDELLRNQWVDSLDELRERNQILIDRKLSSLGVYHRNRLKRIEAELAAATDERIKRMKESERIRVEREFETPAWRSRIAGWPTLSLGV